MIHTILTDSRETGSPGSSLIAPATRVRGSSLSSAPDITRHSTPGASLNLVVLCRRYIHVAPGPVNKGLRTSDCQTRPALLASWVQMPRIPKPQGSSRVPIALGDFRAREASLITTLVFRATGTCVNRGLCH